MLTPHDVLGEGKLIARRLPKYETRPQQLRMAEQVAAAIATEQHLIVEAGTGVGKSFAYLVPAILASHQESGRLGGERETAQGRRVDAYDQSTRAAHQKGLAAVVQRNSARVHFGSGQGAAQLHQPQATGQRGEPRSDVVHPQRGTRRVAWIAGLGRRNERRFAGRYTSTARAVVWDEVASDSGNCLGRNCPTYEKCFYFRARRRIHNAQIIVVNHALLFSDLALSRIGVSLLPDYDVLVLDEAHTVEAVASEHLGVSVSGAGRLHLESVVQRSIQQGLAGVASSR